MSNNEALQFCSEPTLNHPNLEREPTSYDELPDLKEGLIIKKHAYKQQYASLYYIRLVKLRAAALKSAHQRWRSIPEKPTYTPKILDIKPGELCYMLGTLYLEMPSKPNVMKNLEDENSIIRPNTPLKYRSDNDIISLEDESGRVEISGACLEKEILITGTVIGILGKEVSSGVFEVVDVCVPGMADQDPLPTHQKDNYVALLSGLGIGSEKQLDMKIELLSEFLQGELGSTADEKSSASITRVIIAGNSVAKPIITVDSKTPKKYGYDSSTFNASPMLQLDEVLEEIASSVDVDVMSGLTDPSPTHLPQQPMLPSMFVNAHKLNSFQTVTNPYWCKIDDITFLGTSGQNLDDICRYTDNEDRLKLAESCIYWRHMAPSAPDTLWAYPFQDRDPFILEKTPHVYFIGNQPQFEDRLLLGSNGQKVRIVLVPSFAETGIVVLVNLKTLECSAVHISENGIKATEEMDES